MGEVSIDVVIGNISCCDLKNKEIEKPILKTIQSLPDSLVMVLDSRIELKLFNHLSDSVHGYYTYF